MNSQKEIIGLYHVDKLYPPKQSALRNIDFMVQPGEFVFVAGASGAGKSTLLKLLFAQERCSRGEVFVGGRDVSKLSESGIAKLRRNIGVIFQDYKLLPRHTVLENVAFALEVVGVKQKERVDAAYQMLSAVGLKDKVRSMPLTLSGGEQQRVAIARALVLSLIHI